MILRVALLTVFAVYAFIGGAISFSNINLAWQYDVNSDVRLCHRVFQQGESTRVFLQIDADSLAKWQCQFLVQDGYDSESDRSVELEGIDTLKTEKNGVLLQLILPKIDEDLFVVRISDFVKNYYYDIALKIGNLNYPSIYPVDSEGSPILKNYIIRSGHRWMGSDSFFAMKYLDDYSFADPPMAKMKPLAPQADLDSSFLFLSGYEFDSGFFYVVREDSSSSTGVTMLRLPPYFPEYRQLNELVASMLYITSEPERKSLLESNDIKKTFDSFWINNFKTTQRARDAIRNYYDWVEKSNLLFTDFKPGWKTDRGMIYIVYGLPDEVYRSNGVEEWYYDTGEAFEFTVFSSFFAAKNYSLRRDLKFEEGWYNKIAEIRRGMK